MLVAGRLEEFAHRGEWKNSVQQHCFFFFFAEACAEFPEHRVFLLSHYLEHTGHTGEEAFSQRGPLEK